jgi:hypothetical protein
VSELQKVVGIGFGIVIKLYGEVSVVELVVNKQPGFGVGFCHLAE